MKLNDDELTALLTGVTLSVEQNDTMVRIAPAAIRGIVAELRELRLSTEDRAALKFARELMAIAAGRQARGEE